MRNTHSNIYQPLEWIIVCQTSVVLLIFISRTQITVKDRLVPVLGNRTIKTYW